MTRSILSIIILIVAAYSYLHAEDRITREEITTEFDSIGISGVANVELIQGGMYKVVVDGPEELVSRTLIKVEDGELEISLKGGKWNTNYDRKLEYFITLPSMKELEVSGATTLTSKNTWEGERLDLDVTGASKVKLKLNYKLLSSDFEGATSIELTGHAKEHKLSAEGASKLSSEELITEAVSAQVAGASNIKVYAQSFLRAEAEGASSIIYYGNPQFIERQSSGVSSIRSGE